MDRQLVTTEVLETPAEARTPYERVLLTPRHTPPRTGRYFQRLATWKDLPYILPSIARSQYIAVDFETKGTDYSWNFQTHDPADESVEVVGIGLAWDTGSAYLPWTELYNSQRQAILGMLREHRGLIAHNVYFDGGVLETLVQGVEWHACTLALYRLLSNEGYAGQVHGLKSAMTEILQWQDTNETDLDKWLVLGGYYKGNISEELAKDTNVLFTRWTEGTLRPDKSQMWRAPHEILGKYCVLDAEATYLLYTEHLLPALQRFPTLEADFRQYWMYLVHLHIHQKIHGIQMDRRGLERRREELVVRLDELEEEFRALEEVAPHIATLEQEMLAELAAKEPARYKKLPPMPTEPPRTKKDGTPSKNWVKWKELVDSGKYTVPVQSLSWEAWSERWKDAVSGRNPDYRLNIQSGQQLSRLLYDMLGHEVRIRTESGLPGTGSDALAHMGKPGEILIARDDALKELGFVQKYLELIEHRDSIHPSFSLPGTSTGRLSSKDPNLQQVKKTKAMMDLFVAREGYSWVDLDFHALEPVTTTEFSEDSNMFAIYGEGAAPNDIYLFVAYTVPQWRPALDATGYNPYSPTKETLARAKADPVTKHIRKVAKVVVLACAYGAGVDKIYSNLVNDGVQITREEVRTVHEGYWKLFSGVRTFGYDLQDKWWETVDLPPRLVEQYRNWSKDRVKRERVPVTVRGYILNGFSRPMCLTHDYRKDTLNRFIQSTGHDIMVRYIYLVAHELDARSIPWYPLIVDFHDAITVEVPDEYVPQTVEVYHYAMAELNRQLGGKIRHKGVPTVGKTLAEVKEPEN